MKIILSLLMYSSFVEISGYMHLPCHGKNGSYGEVQLDSKLETRGSYFIKFLCVMICYLKSYSREANENFQGYFAVQDHEVETRNNLCLLKLPKIKTEYALNSFCFMGAKMYNELPTEIRRTETFNGCFKSLKKHCS